MYEKKYQQIFIEYYNNLHLFATKYVGSDMADDIVQNVFLKLWETDPKFRDNQHIKLYLYKSTYHSCLNIIKHERYKNRQLNAILIEMEDLSDDFYQEEYLESKLLLKLFEAIDKLPERCKEVFILSYMDELNVQKIAEKLNVSINTIKTQRLRAKESLRSYLKKSTHLILIIFN